MRAVMDPGNARRSVNMTDNIPYAAVTDLEPGLAAARSQYPGAVAGTDGLRLELDFDKED